MGLFVRAMSVWQYRGFVVSSIANEFRTRLSRSRLGTAWIVLQPLAMVLIFATVLSEVLAAKLPGIDDKHAYAAYLLAGMACWSLFADILQRCSNVFIENGTLLKKIQFPRSALPLITVGAALVANVTLLLVIVVLLPLLGFGLSLHVAWLPLLVAITIALATGIGVFLGVLNVFVRDVGQVLQVMLQFWFWVTPIVYPITVVPESLRTVLFLNPVTPLVDAYHSVLVYGRAPGIALLYPAALALIALGLSLLMFRRASAEMVDVL